MKAEFINLLNIFIEVQIKNGVKISSGLNEQSLLNIELGFNPFKISSELFFLYLKCNGSNGSDSEINSCLFSVTNFFLSFETCLKHYNKLKEMSDDIGLIWPDALLPIGETNDGYLLTVMSKGEERALNSKMFYFDAALGDFEIYQAFDSLEQLLKVMVHLSKYMNDNNIKYDEYESIKIISDKYEQLMIEFANENVSKVYNIEETNNLPSDWFS